MFVKVLLMLMLATAAMSATAETVYKWVDARGQVHYSDRPPVETGARVLSVFQRTVGLADEEGNESDDLPPAPQEPPSFEDAAGTEDNTAAAVAVQRDLAAIRADQCQQSQQRYKQYIESRRLFRETPDGQRVYLTDEELSLARVEAKQAVDEYCN